MVIFFSDDFTACQERLQLEAAIITCRISKQHCHRSNHYFTSHSITDNTHICTEEREKKTHKGGKCVREMAMHSEHDEPMPRQSFANPMRNPHTRARTAVAQFKEIKAICVISSTTATTRSRSAEQRHRINTHREILGVKKNKDTQRAVTLVK